MDKRVFEIQEMNPSGGRFRLETKSILFALGLTVLAGISTGIGGLFAFLSHRTNTKLLSVVLGFSAGIMIYVSFVEILMEAGKHLVIEFGHVTGAWVTIVSFFGGMFLIAIIDKLIPALDNPHESHKLEEMEQCQIQTRNRKLLRTGLFTAVAIAIHNFPEGLATFASAVKQPELGVAIAFAIAIHNIPEGIAVAVPVYCATGSRKRALGMSLLSGLSEPAGAVIGYLLLLPFYTNAVFGILFAAVAGIMVFISLDELLPTAREYGEHHLSIYGLIAGMMVMAISLLLFIPRN